MDNFIGRAYANVNLKKLKSNYDAVHKLVPHETMVMAVVKADAYGHGMVEIATALQSHGCKWLSVASAEEAVTLVEHKIHADILVMGVCFDAQIDEIISLGIRLTVTSLDFAKRVSENAVKRGIDAYIHIKIDTGMNRLGFKENFEEIIEMAKLPNLVLEGIYSHFAMSDGCDDFTNQQFAQFIDIIDHLKKQGVTFKIRHIANSGAVLEHPEFSLDMVRVGVLIYGLSPCSTSAGAKRLRDLGILPILSLKSHVAHVKMISAGESVGYGRTYIASHDMEVATIALGYGDGVSRALSNKGSVIINGTLCPIIGTVCMDQLMVASSGAKPGDVVTYIGEGQNSEEIATIQGTINYEIVTSISQRVIRKYINN